MFSIATREEKMKVKGKKGKNRFRKEKTPYITARTIMKIVLAAIVLGLLCAVAVTSNAYIDEKEVLEILKEDDPNLVMLKEIHRGIIADTTLVAVSATNDGKLVNIAYSVDSDINRDYTFQREVR